MDAFRHLAENIPNWGKWLSELEEEIKNGQIELAKERRICFATGLEHIQHESSQVTEFEFDASAQIIQNKQRRVRVVVYGDAWVLYSFSEFDRSLKEFLSLLCKAKNWISERAAFNECGAEGQPQTKLHPDTPIEACTEVNDDETLSLCYLSSVPPKCDDRKDKGQDAYESLRKSLDLARELCRDAVEAFLQYGDSGDLIPKVRRELDETFKQSRWELEDADQSNTADLSRFETNGHPNCCKTRETGSNERVEK
jgi:hypothetical protein